MSCREHGKGWGTRPAINDGAGPGGGRRGGEVGGFWVHLKVKLTKFASRLDVGGPGRLRKKPTALRYHRSRKDRRDMARKQQITSQVRTHRQLHRLHSWPCECVQVPENQAPHTAPKSQQRTSSGLRWTGPWELWHLK